MSELLAWIVALCGVGGCLILAWRANREEIALLVRIQEAAERIRSLAERVADLEVLRDGLQSENDTYAKVIAELQEEQVRLQAIERDYQRLTDRDEAGRREIYGFSRRSW